MMNFITYEQLNLFQTLINCFPFFQRRKRKKPRGKFWFINLLQKLMKLIKTMLTKKSKKQLFFFCKDFEPRLGGGQKYSRNRSKSSNKWKCHEGWSLKTLRFIVLRTNNVGEYFEGPKKMIEMFDGGELKRCQIAMDCKSLVGKANLPKRKVETIFTQLRK